MSHFGMHMDYDGKLGSIKIRFFFCLSLCSPRLMREIYISSIDSSLMQKQPTNKSTDLRLFSSTSHRFGRQLSHHEIAHEYGLPIHFPSLQSLELCVCLFISNNCFVLFYFACQTTSDICVKPCVPVHAFVHFVFCIYSVCVCLRNSWNAIDNWLGPNPSNYVKNQRTLLCRIIRRCTDIVNNNGSSNDGDSDRLHAA